MTSRPEGRVWEFYWFLKKKKPVSWDLTLDGASWDSAGPVVVYGMRRAFVRSLSWDLSLGEASWFLSLGEANPVEATGCTCIYWVRWNRQLSKNCVSLFPCLKPKPKKVNKRFVPEQKKVVSVSGFSCICTFYVSVYFTHPHICIMAIQQIDID